MAANWLIFGEPDCACGLLAHMVLRMVAILFRVFTLRRSPVMLQAQGEPDGSSGQQHSRNQSGSGAVRMDETGT